MSVRELVWDGCVNVRDLGGHPTEDGESTRFGGIVRADSVRKLSEAGWEALVDYGVRTVVDLRFHEELEADPPRDLPVDVVHVSLLGEWSEEWGLELDELARGAGDTTEGTRLVYLDFLERTPERFAEAISAVAQAGEGPVVVHCAGGKDRTGLVVALLLRLAGVPADAVAEDYSLSGDNLQSHQEQWIAEAEDEVERARRERIAATPAAAMLGVLEELERRHGSVSGFLRAAGLSDEELGLARARLRR